MDYCKDRLLYDRNDIGYYVIYGVVCGWHILFHNRKTKSTMATCIVKRILILLKIFLNNRKKKEILS